MVSLHPFLKGLSCWKARGFDISASLENHGAMSLDMAIFCRKPDSLRNFPDIIYIPNTSIAARGGGGSFKREKYIMQKNMWL